MKLEPSIVADELNGFAYVWSPPSQAGGPTLVLLHGTGGDEYDLLNVGRNLAPGAGLLSPRGRVLEGGRANRFFRRLAEGVFDVEDLKLRTRELAEFIASAAERHGFDRSSVSAVGFSNGANIAASLMLLYPAVLRSAALLSPMVPLVPDEAPDLAGRRVFIGAGRADPIATPDETERLAALLRVYGADVAVRFEPVGHSVTQTELDAVRRWLAET